MNHFPLFVRESGTGVGLGASGQPPATVTGPVEAAVDGVLHSPSTIVVAVVFGLLTLVALRFLVSRENKLPVGMLLVALIVGTVTAFLSSQKVDPVQGYRPFVDGLVFGVAVLVAILQLAAILYPGARNANAPKGAGIAAALFFVLFGLASIPEIEAITSIRVILISLSGVLALASGVLLNSYVGDGLAKTEGQPPGGAKLLMLSAWFWLFYPLVGVVSVFLLTPDKSLFVYDIVHVLAMTMTSVAIFLLRPSPVAAKAEKDSAAPSAPTAPAPAAATTKVMRKPEPARQVISRPARPPKPKPSSDAPGNLPSAPPPPKPKKRY